MDGGGSRFGSGGWNLEGVVGVVGGRGGGGGEMILLGGGRLWEDQGSFSMTFRMCGFRISSWLVNGMQWWA